MLPNTTHVLKNQNCAGGKKAKDRITVLVGASAIGEKLPLLVIGKSKQPRCFRNANIPLKYTSNKKAWMTAEIFTSYIREVDRRMMRENRKIAILLDNCSAHPVITDLTSCTLYFLPPNTTAVTQPMDAGVIRNLKSFYRRDLVRRKINALDAGVEFSINILQALCILNKSWSSVTARTITNCYRHVGFEVHTDIECVEDAENDPNIFIVGDDIEVREFADVSFEEFIDLDNYLATAETRSVVMNGLPTTVQAVDSDDEEGVTDDVGETPVHIPTTFQEAMAAVFTLESFLQEQDNSLAQYMDLQKIKDFLIKKKTERLSQTTVTSYFSI